MTRYRFDNIEKKKGISRGNIVAMVLVVVAGFFIIFFVIAPVIRDAARGPAWLRNATETTFHDQVSMLSPKSKLIAEINNLKSKLSETDAQAIELQILRDENIALRQELSYEKNPANVILAGVLAKPSESLYNSIIIDQGSNDGIFEGQLVTTQGTIGLGRISSVTPNTATVTLFSGPQFDGELIIQGQNITVPAHGKGGGNFEIHIPREIEVNDGDILVFPEHSNLAVGIVKSIQFDARDPFQTVLARTPVNVQQLRFVEVVK